jgi:voltage-gated potassium channel Kch
VPYELTFDEAHDYGHSDPREGIAVPVTLSAGDTAAHLTASVDTGASFCIFERGYGELLGLDVEAGELVVLGTATGTFKAYGHAVMLTTLGYSFDVVVYFAAHEGFGRNVLGRRGWLDRVRLGLVDYEGKLYLSRYEE